MKNVLIITADHMRHDALGCNGNGFVRTPNIDRLAAGGVNFANSFTPNPICVPARASITTGNYPHRCTGIKNNSGRIRDGQAKLAEHFAARGYETYAVGKLHYVPYAPPGRPRLLHGFHHCELCEEGRIIGEFDPHGKLRGLEDYHDYLYGVGWGGYERAHGTGNNDVHAAPCPLPAEHHEEAWVANRTVAHLREHVATKRGRPFLMWASFTKPHAPYDPPEPWDRMYDPRAVPPPIGSLGALEGRDRDLRRRPIQYGWDRLSPEAVQVARAHYFGLVSFQDAMIGRILGFLDEAGVAGDTIVVYTADHGDLLGDFGNFFKTNFFDGSVKVPLMFRAPGLIPAGQTRMQLATLADILPTLCSLVGAALDEEVDGSDLSDVLRSGDAPGRDFVISQTQDAPHQKYMVRTREWKYVYCEEGATEELYDVANDRHELRNLAGDPAHAAETAELHALLLRWCVEHGDEQMITGGKLARSPVSREEPRFNDRAMGWRWY